jgi:hypothetical protein
MAGGWMVTVLKKADNWPGLFPFVALYFKHNGTAFCRNSTI